jgi:uncharacterized phage-like protein YoqJ
MIICGTGHRPNKLGGYGLENEIKISKFAIEYLAINRDEIDFVISGGALGWDTALAHAAHSVRIPYCMALPFRGFESRWPVDSQKYLDALMTMADDIHYVCEDGYAPWKMQKRNEWMVDKADSVLALWNGTDGGTANCVRYAEKVGKPITNLWSEWEREGN